jgi:hypothetical protein
MSRLNGITVPGPASTNSSSQSDEWVVRLTVHHRRVSTRVEGAYRAFLGVESAQKGSGIGFAADDSDQDRAIEHDHVGSPVLSS